MPPDVFVQDPRLWLRLHAERGKRHQTPCHERPDLTLDEILAEVSKAGIATSRTALWRFYERHRFSFKKNFVCGGAKASRGGPRAMPLDATAGHV